MHASAVTPPIVPKGKTRVRICLHAGNTKEDVEKLAMGIIQWAVEFLPQQAQNGKWGRKVFLEEAGRVPLRIQNKL